jgi:ABC-type nitrate/sulfonate/bicarbonate transport system permease component
MNGSLIRRRVAAALATAGAPCGALVVGLAAWLSLYETGAISAVILPSPARVAAALWENRILLLTHGRVTCTESLGGFLLGTAAAAGSGLAIVSSRLVSRAVGPWLVAGLAFPKEALSPVLAAWLGYQVAPKVLLAAMICFFPLAIAFSRGLLTVDGDVVDLLRVLNASRREELIKYRLPNAVPDALIGCRLALPLSLIGAIVGEFAGSAAGLGYLIRLAKGHLESGLVFAALLVLLIIGVLYTLAIAVVERALHRYADRAVWIRASREEPVS